MLDSSSVLPEGQDEGSVAPENAADALRQAVENGETEQLSDQSTQAPEQGVSDAEAQAAQQYDWDSDENPYKERLRRMQGRLQQEIEEKRAYEHRLLQEEQQKVYQQAQQMHPDDRQAYIQQWQAQRQQQARETALQQREQALEEAARQTWMRDTAIKYGIPQNELAYFRDPDSMEYHAARLANERRQNRKVARQAQGNDRFEGESPGRPQPDRKPASYDEAQRMFVELAERHAAQ